MKRIVILCDGTWNRSDSATPTNVVRLARLLEGFDAEGRAQVPVYVQGVGTGEGVTRGARALDRVLGGAFGWGLLENVVEAYRHLVFLYQPGDEISIFGFSRGAYTARSLTGLIRSTGLVGRDDLHLIPHAVARYRTRGDARLNPRTDDSAEFRAQTMRSCVATSEGERAWRRANGAPDVPLLRIAHLGVWDSVGALGVPRHMPVLGRRLARRHQFHDADLSSLVRSARHAVALDERRRAFEPTRWTNLPELNRRARGEGTASEAPYQELFFPGDHGSVGGGGDITDLSSIALAWIVEGAQAAGVAFDAGRLRDLRAEANPLGPLANRSEPPRGFAEWLMRRDPVDREGPASLEELHASALDRWLAEGKAWGFTPYRPGSLRRLEAELTRHRASLVREAEAPTTRIV